jgi:hypothetical protein
VRVHQADRVQLVGVRKADGLAVKEWTRQLESVKTKMVQKRLWKGERHRRDEEVSLICQEKVVRRIDWRLGTPGYRIQGIAKRAKKREGSGGGNSRRRGKRCRNERGRDNDWTTAIGVAPGTFGG